MNPSYGETLKICLFSHQNLLDHEPFGGAHLRPHDKLHEVFIFHLTQCGNNETVVPCPQIGQGGY